MTKSATILASTGLTAGAICMMAAESVEELELRVVEIQDASAAIDAKGDEMTPEDMAALEKNAETVDLLNRRIAVKKRTTAISAGTGAGRRSTAEPTVKDGRPSPAVPRVINMRGEFNSFGEFAQAVRVGSIQGNEPDQRLKNVASTFGSEGVGADGGFLVPPEFSRDIMTKVLAEENLLSRAAQLQVSGNSMTIPKDETTPWQSSGGIQVYWEGEAASISPSKPAFEMSTMRLAKLTALVPLSDELLEDATGLESWLRAKAPAKMAAKINTAMIRGSGVGMPLGLLNSPSKVSVAKETSQNAGSVYFANINNMWSRMYAGWRRNAIWLINQDIEPQLDAMAFDPDAASKVPVYLGPNGVSGSPYATLKGRPVVPLEACSAAGTEGDIILVDWNQYWALTKAQGVKVDTSIHLYFDQALTTFRFIFRLNGQPAWASAITRENGSNTLSWAVTLADRA